MKLVRDMSKIELIELLAAVSLRMSGFIFCLSAVRESFLFSHYLSSLRPAESLATYTSKTYVMDISYDAVIALLMFVLTVPLSRLICRGLDVLLQIDKPAENLPL